MRTSEYFRAIIKSIKNNPEDWEFSRHISSYEYIPYEIKNEKANIELWICSGPGFYKTGSVDPGHTIFLWIFVPWRVELWLTIQPLIKKWRKLRDLKEDLRLLNEINRLEKKEEKE